MGGNHRQEQRIVKTKLGKNTGESYWQTGDGRWWKNWDGIDRTREEVCTKVGNIVK